MIYGSVKKKDGWHNFVMLENYDIQGATCVEVREKFKAGEKYEFSGNAVPFRPNLGPIYTPFNNWCKKMNEAAKQLRNYDIEHAEEKKRAESERGDRKKLFSAFEGDHITFCVEDDFDLPKSENVASREEEEEPMEAPAMSTGADPSKPVVPLVEPPEEPNGDTPLPSSMKALENMLGISGSFASPYDFSLRNIKPPSKPSVNSAMKAYCTATVLAIARALVARHYGKKFSKEQVKASLRRDFSTYAILKPSLEILQNNSSLLSVGEMLKRCDADIDNYIGGDVKVTAKYMANYYGQPWSIESFIRYQSRNYRISFKAREKMPHRATKK
jgi:hypothetical protein